MNSSNLSVFLNKKSCQPRRISHWRIRSQILFVQFVISMVILGLIIGYNFLQELIHSKGFKSAQLEVLFQANDKWLLNMINDVKDNTQHILSLNKEMVNKVIQLFVMVTRNNNPLVPSYKECQIEGQYPISPQLFSMYDWFCYGLFGDLNAFDPIHKESVQLVNLLHIWTPLTRSGQQQSLNKFIYFGTESEQQFFASYPSFHIPIQFKPHSRPWYLQSKENYMATKQNTFIVTKPYLDQVYKRKITSITKALVDGNGTFHGVVGADIEISAFINYFKKHHIRNCLIVDSDGNIIVDSNEHEPDVLNKTIISTGFNEQDWLQIQHVANQQPFLNNCTSNLQSSLLCRYNSWHDHDLFIVAKPITTFNLVIIMYLDQDDYVNKVDEMIDMVLQKIKFQIYRQMVGQLIFGMGLLGISNLLLLWLLKPIEQLIRYNRKRFSSKGVISLDSVNLYTIRVSGTLGLLVKSYIRILQSFTQDLSDKSAICLQIESIIYPVVTWLPKIQWKNQLVQAMDFHFRLSDHLQDLRQSINLEKFCQNEQVFMGIDIERQIKGKISIACNELTIKLNRSIMKKFLKGHRNPNLTFTWLKQVFKLL